MILSDRQVEQTSADPGIPGDYRGYPAPFRFTDKLLELAIKIDRPKLTPEDTKRLMEALRNNKVSE